MNKNDRDQQAKKHGLQRGLTNYGDSEFAGYLRRSFARSMGISKEMLEKPIIGIAMTPSGFNSCHRGMPELVDAVSRGVLAAGALPRAFPTISLGEVFLKPTSMVYRNLMAMDTEEMVSAQPMDAVVLIGGCDKTVPAQLMGAASAGVPAIQLVTGSMLTGSHRAERVGACTDCRRFWGMYRGDEIDTQEINAVNNQLVASVGTCSVMGTASTMACIAEALGIMLPGGAAPPAVTAARTRIAEQTGTQAVAMIEANLTPDRILTAQAFENALCVLLAIGGSTNGIIHLAAIAGRCGIRIDLGRLDLISNKIPVLVNLKPSGNHYMEDLHAAGGLVTVLREISPFLHLDALTVTGRTLGDEIENADPPFAQDVVRPISNPIYPQGGIVFLRGNLAPGGAIIKQSAASDALMEHESRVVVFDGLEDLARRIDDPDLDVLASDILLLKNIGPKGAPGMPEAGYIPIPRKLARQGVKDMVRISDGRMSGTAAGTIVLHVTPESADGGPLALVETGDRIRLSVSERQLDLLISDAEFAQRRRTVADIPIREEDERGYRNLFMRSVTQADTGCDFDFLQSTKMTTTIPLDR